MTHRSLSNSQALRVIGQRLGNVEITVFELKKRDDVYVVEVDPSSAMGHLPKGKIEPYHSDLTTFRGCPKKFPLILEFTAAELRWCDDENRSKRIRSAALPVVGNLSLMLRVLGDFIDRKAPDEFTISWLSHSASLRYGELEYSFSPHNIYDLGIVMYLKRSSERSEKSGARFVPEQRNFRPNYGIQTLTPSYK